MQQGSLLIVALIVALEVVALAIMHWSVFEVKPVPLSADAPAYQPANIVELSRSENVAAIDER
jgi:hypothetical protein